MRNYKIINALLNEFHKESRYSEVEAVADPINRLLTFKFYRSKKKKGEVTINTETFKLSGKVENGYVLEDILRVLKYYVVAVNDSRKRFPAKIEGMINDVLYIYND